MPRLKQYLLVILIYFSFISFSIGQDYMNLSFENTELTTAKPKFWYTYGDGFTIAVDTTIFNHGKTSLKIQNNEGKKHSFGLYSGVFPNKSLNSKNVRFTCWVRTTDVENGYAGIWWRISDKEGETMFFDNMDKKGLEGTHDWVKVELTTEIDSKAEEISFGGLLTGSGTAWFDNVQFFVDDEEIEPIVLNKKELSKKQQEWLNSNIQPIEISELGTITNPTLEFLRDFTKDIKIVGLGEVTHGSSEIFKVKNNLIQFLVSELGFNIFSLEANQAKAIHIDNYISAELSNDNPKSLIQSLGYWTWSTYEMMDLVNWFKSYSSETQKIKFTGFDIKNSQFVIDELINEFENGGVDKVVSELRSLRSYILNRPRTGNQIEWIAECNDKIDKVAKLSNSNFESKNGQWRIKLFDLLKKSIIVSEKNRDKFMAENVQWISNQSENSKLILWAHNNHVRNLGKSMGRTLKEHYGSEYLSVGFLFYDGEYSAYNNGRIEVCQSKEAFPGTYEYLFSKVSPSVFALDLRNIDNVEETSWLFRTLVYRDVGAIKPIDEFKMTSITDNFDVILFIRKSSPSRLLN